MRLLMRNDMIQFAEVLSRLGVECKVANDPYVADRSLRRIHMWRQSMRRFARLVKDFNPDVVIASPGFFGAAALKANIPLITYLVGDYWQEIETAWNLHYKTFPRNIISKRHVVARESCLHGSKFIMTVSKYLEEIVRRRLPSKPVYTLYTGTDPSVWYPEEGMNLKHPCVGLVQQATIWDKTKEMLTLKRVLDRHPNVTFYWAGGGRYTDAILAVLQKYPNFQHLGRLSHPDKVRQFLTEIDIYALLTGLDMSPWSLREAMLMEKPTIATNIGGIPEIMEDGKSGFLVERGETGAGEIVGKISYLLGDQKQARQMGRYGRELIKKNFSPVDTAKRFMSIMEKEMDLH